MTFSPDDFAHLKIPFENILSATNNFDRRCVKDGFGKTYSGQLLWSGELIKIYAQRLDKKRDDEKEQQFWMEIFMLSTLKHKNLVSLVGFCDENDEKIIITRRETRGSLVNYLSDPMLLTWVRRLEISLGIAQALSYIHYDESRDFSVIHRNISHYRVELNDEWEPKLCDFISSMKIKASERHNSFHTNTVQYPNMRGDPTYIETKSVNHKSDMYSFGILLIELLGVWIYNLVPQFITHYREKKLDNMVNKDLWKQIDFHSFNMFAEIAYECLDEERSRRPNIDDIVPRIKKALELACENRLIHSCPNHLAHLRIPIEDFLSATRGSLSSRYEENVDYNKGGIGEIYEGQLSWCGELIDITFRRLINSEWDEKEQQFWTEISMLSSLKHKNIVSLIGFCNEVGLETIIYKRGFGERLTKYLSNPMLLTWVKRLEVSVGVAHALSYIHYDEPRDFSVIHRNISTDAVRLNNDWEPKLSEFQHSMKIKASERHHSFLTDSVWSMKGRTNPTCEKTNIVNHKSDIYSFGMLLFELLFGRESVIDDDDNKYLAPVAIFHYREKILDEIIDPDLLKQMDLQSLNIFAETAYECLSEEQSQRPNMDQIVTRLEKALELQLEWKKTEYSSVVAEVGETSSSHEKGSKSHFISPGIQSHLSKKTMSSYEYRSYTLSFKEIERATNNFAPKNILKKNPVESVYQGDIVLWIPRIYFGDIVARRINYLKDEREKFEMKVGMLLSLKHKNLVPVIGFCDERDAKFIIYEKEANGSLNKYLSDQTLSWTQRLEICLGVANALSYIHYDVARDFSVIHCNIKSSKILLDDKWEPKLSGLEHSLNIH